MLDLSVGELVQVVEGRLSLGTMPPLAGEATPIGRIATDSRRVQPGDVFWALVGENHDGGSFVDEAFARGAAGVVAARRVEPWAGCWSIVVSDTQQALWRLAASVRRRFAGQVIGVTGSVGKTTTRQMIHTALGRRLEGTASPGNFNNQFGLPLSMLQWSPLNDYAVVEMGASAKGEIAALASLAEPQIGVITCIGEAHLGGFGSRAEIAQAKGELLEALPRDGWAVLNGDDPWLPRVARKCSAKVLWIGRSSDCNFMASEVSCAGGMLTFRVDGCKMRVPVWGRHYLTAALAAVAVGRILGLSLGDLSSALAGLQLPPQRCQVIQIDGRWTIINDTYNASPTSMRAALELLRDFNSPGRRVVICGDMRELGDETRQSHRQLGRQVINVCGADWLVACGQAADEVVAGAYEAGMPSGRALACQSADEAEPILRAIVAPGDVVLVKGSRAVAMERLVEALTTATPVARAA